MSSIKIQVSPSLNLIEIGAAGVTNNISIAEVVMYYLAFIYISLNIIINSLQ